MEITNLPKTYLISKNLSYSCQYHVIFCAKYRRKVLAGDIEKRLREIIMEKQQEFGYTVTTADISPDHVHLILDISPELAVLSVIGKLKAYTSHVLRDQFAELRSRIPTLWTRVNFISSVGNVSLGEIENYLENQKKR